MLQDGDLKIDNGCGGGRILVLRCTGDFMTKGKTAETGIVLVAYLLVILVLTWPLVTHLGQSIPAGSDFPTVSLFQLFVLEWNTHFLEERTGYWNAPFYHPHTGTLAWSEPQLLSGIFGFLLSKLGIGSTAAYNLIVLAFLMLAAFMTYLLSRQLTDDTLSAFLSGIWVACGAYMMHQMAVLHLLAIGFPAWFLLALFSLRKGFTFARLTGLFLAYVCTWLSCAQYGLFLTILAPVAFLLAYRLRDLKKRDYLKLGGTGIVTAVALGPYLYLHYRQLTVMGFLRSLADVEGNLFLKYLPIPAKGHWLVGRMLGADKKPDFFSQDPGMVFLLVLARTVGLFATCISSAATNLTLPERPRAGISKN